MSIPKYADFSKAATDLFKDDFITDNGNGTVKLILKSTASNGVAMKVEGTKDNSTNAVNAEFESKFTTASGITLKETYKSQNQLTTEVSVKNKIVKGSSASLAVTFNTEKIQSFKAKTDYACKKNFTDFVFDGKTLTASSVYAVNSFLLGASAEFDVAKLGSAPKSYSLGAGYSQGDIVVRSQIKNGTDVEGSIYHTPRINVKAGVQFNFAKNSKNSNFGLVGQYAYDAETTLKAKVDTSLNLNLSYKQALRPSVFLTLQASVSAAKLNSDSNKLGLTLEIAN
jgi:voltage-dependent anion channel protein 2